MPANQDNVDRAERVDRALLTKKKNSLHSSPIGAYHYYQSDFHYSMPDMNQKPKMHGVKRVLVFCILIVVLPASLIITPLYLRRIVFANVTIPVAESDVIEIRDGMSSVFCYQHSLSMSSKFSAFQLGNKPKMSTNHKHHMIRLKKSMTLPDDTFEYWGFYLLKGAKVHLKFCSRYEGSRILVVKGQRILSTCNLLDHNRNKLGAGYAEGHDQVKVFFEDITEITDHLPEEGSHIKSNIDDLKQHNKSAEQHMEEENHAGEQLDDDGKFPQLFETNQTSTTMAPATTLKHRKKLKKATGPKKPKTTTTPITPLSSESKTSEHTKRSAESQQLYENLYKPRQKREQVLDRKYSHGGNAANFTETDESNSISSFETALFECYDGKILLAEGFPPTPSCLSPHFLENGSQSMLTTHEVQEDGYYYYIFYSDNDLVRNDIHAIFDIYQISFQYSNISGSQSCINVTDCTFSVKFMSDEIVVVEVPTHDGIENDEDDISYLISTCHPRTEIYAIFPIMVLVLIISCAFL